MKSVGFLFIVLFYLNAFAQKDTSRRCLNKYAWGHAQAQKPALDLEGCAAWNNVAGAAISDNGRFVSYFISNLPHVHELSLVLKAIDGSYEETFPGGRSASFTRYGDLFLCTQQNGYLNIVDLNKQNRKQIHNVSKYSASNNGHWVAYLEKDSTDFRLVLRDLKKDRESIFYNVTDYVFSGLGEDIFLKMKSDNNNFSIIKVDLEHFYRKKIYSGLEPYDIVSDSLGGCVAFLTVEKTAGGDLGNALWFYHSNKQEQATKVENDIINRSMFDVINLSSISNSGNLVYLMVSPKENSIIKKASSLVDVFTYVDPDLRHKSQDKNKNGYLAVWNIEDKRIYQLLREGENNFYVYGDQINEMLIQATGHRGEWNWNKDAIPQCVLLNLSNGHRTRISDSLDRNALSYRISPSGKTVIYFNADSQSYFSLNLASGIRRNITRDVSTKWTTFDNDDVPFSKYLNIGVAGFSPDEKKVYLYDRNDIFVADISGKGSAVNLTNGYGKDNGLVLRFAFPTEKWTGDRIILTAFNRDTKDDGFYQLELKGRRRITKLIMEAAIYTGPEESKYIKRNLPMKARNADVYLVKRMTATSAPNLYYTKDFKVFTPITDVHSEKRFNWLKTELIDFTTLDGRLSQGILYKPGNFDSTKKYPVIFYYYEKVTECLNLYLIPELCSGTIDIPYFVSNGYLVFTPDINFKIGYPGRSSYNAVMGAANKISSFSYVDSSRMGLQGHSFGGFQTNYIVAHTNRFRAACSAAGFTNYVSAYGSIIGNGYSRQGQYELYRDRIGTTLWKRPDLYLENSPVFNIDKIETPLLIMHNKKDMDVPVEQGIEFFTGLRRLGKVAYFLQYEGEGHILIDDKAVKDYTTRMMDFFDYYLRDKKLPNWMSDKKAIILEVAL